MSTNTIPKILKDMLDTLLMDNAIVSWNIRGDNDMTNLNIRFANNMADNMDIAYKKVSQSRIKRDNKRQSEWKATKEQLVAHAHMTMDSASGTDFRLNQSKFPNDNCLKNQGTSPCEPNTVNTSGQYLQPKHLKEPCRANLSNVPQTDITPKDKTAADQRDQYAMKGINNIEKVTKQNDEATENIVSRMWSDDQWKQVYA